VSLKVSFHNGKCMTFLLYFGKDIIVHLEVNNKLNSCTESPTTRTKSSKSNTSCFYSYRKFRTRLFFEVQRR